MMLFILRVKLQAMTLLAFRDKLHVGQVALVLFDVCLTSRLCIVSPYAIASWLTTLTHTLSYSHIAATAASCARLAPARCACALDRTGSERIISSVMAARSNSGRQSQSVRAQLSSMLSGHESAMSCLKSGRYSTCTRIWRSDQKCCELPCDWLRQGCHCTDSIDKPGQGTVNAHLKIATAVPDALL
jgi:hypothetical protein